MVSLIFYFGSEIVMVKVEQSNLLFAKVQGQNLQFAPIEGLKFSPTGLLKECPDLEGKPFDEAKKIAIARLKEKIEGLKEKDQVKYLKEDLVKYGYILKLVHRDGFRPCSYETYMNG